MPDLQNFFRALEFICFLDRLSDFVFQSGTVAFESFIYDATSVKNLMVRWHFNVYVWVILISIGILHKISIDLVDGRTLRYYVEEFPLSMTSSSA